MAMGKRRRRQEALFVMADGLPKSPGHPFYRKLNELLAEAEFDRWIERRCRAVLRHRGEARPAVDPAGRVLPHAAGRLLRGHRQPAGHRLAVCRQPEPAAVPGRAAGREARPTTRR